MEDVVLCEVGDDGVALLTLNRPDRLNAWTYGMQVALFDLLEACAEDERVRVIVITGAGRGFCPGADMSDLSALSNDGGAVEARASRTDTRPITFAMSIPKPVIAAINGACAGLGLAFALTCDVRFCAENAKLTTAFSRRGLIAEHGTSWILPQLVGPARALDLLISGAGASWLGSGRARAGQPRRRGRVGARRRSRICARRRRERLPGEHGDDQAAGVQRAEQTARRCAGAGQRVDARIVLKARFRGGGPELCRGAGRRPSRHSRPV